MDFLDMARDAYESSTSYVDSNYRKRWNDALSMFASRHPDDSKYNSDAYKHRSRIFRPKSRAMVRRYEAAAAAAFFSNVDVISTSAVRESDPGQVAGAALMREILQHRLTKTLPWYQILLGGIQDALTVGVVASYQYWKFERRPTGETIDEPCVELIPVENIRFDPAASWVDPIGSSPYLIRLVPMYVTDVKALMAQPPDEKAGRQPWRQLDDKQIQESLEREYDTTRGQREDKREDPFAAAEKPLRDFDIVWAHENFMRLEGVEVVFWTLGTKHMLSEPQLLSDVYFHGKRPVTMGAAIIETHKTMPASVVMLGEQLQREANEIVNQRLDNVKLVLNKRWMVKRGAQVDTQSLLRNVPGAITLVNDTTSDVAEINWPDVTASAYAEQDRVNVDYDELTGNFSSGSVQTNRKMNETVGGMAMISSSANQLTEYTLRTIVETWVEPTLRQLVLLEQAYETDETVLALAAERAQLWQKFGVSQITDDLLRKELTVNVNVGLGATDPAMKLGRFLQATQTYAQIALQPPPNMNLEEVGKEIFGLSGYRDGARFLREVQGDPAMAMQQQMMAQQGQRLQALASQVQNELADKAGEMDRRDQDLDNRETLLKVREMLLNAEMESLRMREQMLQVKASEAQTRIGADLTAAEQRAAQAAQASAQEQVGRTEQVMQAMAQMHDEMNAGAGETQKALADAIAKLAEQVEELQEAIEKSKPTGGKAMRDAEGNLIGVVASYPDGSSREMSVEM